MPLINKINRIGHKLPPWWVPDGTGIKLVEYQRTLVNWDLFVNYELG